MGGVISIIGGAAASAVAFSGTNYEFSKLSDHGADERKKHNRAIEKLQKDRDSWFKERQQRLDFINERLQKERHAERTFNPIQPGLFSACVNLGGGGVIFARGRFFHYNFCFSE